MKKLLLLLSFAAMFKIAVAQQPHCYTSEIYNELIQYDLQYKQNQEALETFTQQNIASGHTGTRQVYIIPLVFHILHDYGTENVSDAEIIHAVELLNIDYRKLNADTVNVIPLFKPIVADCEIEFRLATIDPRGNCTTGIEHIPTVETYHADDSSKVNPNWMVWPNSKYMNIWVAHTLQNPTAAAYAHYPGGSPKVDGVMCWYTYVDNIQRTLTHEIGHCLNLKHVWGDSNTPGVTCGDDAVGDTPETKGWDHCPSTANADVCNVGVVENYQNFMEYSYCDVMFTEGQKTRMRQALVSAISSRNNLWSTANLISTGTNTPNPTNVCVPIPDFKIDNHAACVGGSVHFADVSSNGTVTNRYWSFPGATPSSSTDSTLNVTYAVPGDYDVTLTVTNSAGTDSITKVSVIHISGPPSGTLPFVEDFELPTSFPNADGWVNNYDGFTTWSRVGNASTSGSNSIRMYGYGSTRGAVDEWVTPSFDFTNVGAPISFKFMVAHARRSNTSLDQLKIYYSLNCGYTWIGTSYFKQGANLATAGVLTTNFVPSVASQWRQESVGSLNTLVGKPNVRFKIQSQLDFTQYNSNNIYIDDINISGIMLAVDEVDDLQLGFSLYPNPTDGASAVDFELKNSADVVLDVKDMLGRNVASILNKTMSSGQYTYNLPVLSQGIYLIDLMVNNKHHIRKLVVS